MAFALKRKETLPESLSRISRACVARALKRCDQRTPEAIHAARKEIKKLRALLRFVRKEIGESEFDRANSVLREAAGHLAGPRDAYVRVRALDLLARPRKKGGSEPAWVALRASLEDDFQQELILFLRGGARKAVKRLLRGEAARFKTWEVRENAWRVAGPSLKRAYRAGRGALDKVRRDPAPERFHEWRKQVKDLWHLLQLLQPAWPEQLGALSAEFGKLGDLLGSDHDLHLLRQAAVKKSVEGGLEPEAQRLVALIDARQKSLRAESFKLGGRLFEEKPKDFCGRIHQFWKAWKAKGSRRKPLASAGA